MVITYKTGDHPKKRDLSHICVSEDRDFEVASSYLGKK